MFKSFRKHQKKWMAGLTIGTMLAFAFPATTYFSGAGRGRHRQVEVVETIFDRQVTNDDMQRAKLERTIANAFFQFMIGTVQPQLAARLGNIAIFGSTSDEDIKDAIRLTHKADELGVYVSDDMIRTWISRVTDGKLSTAQFEQVINALGRVAPQQTGEQGISAEAVFDIVRRQLRIEEVRSLVTGRFGDGPSSVTPYEAWQYYRKLNDKLGLEVIPVAVADFANQIEDPGDTALKELYNQGIARLPDPESPDPGFKEPRRVKLQVASVTLDAFMAGMKAELEVTDEEIKQYYDSHKELYRIKSAAPTPAPSIVPEKPASDSDQPPPQKQPESDANKEPESKASESKDPSEDAPEAQDEAAQESNKDKGQDANAKSEDDAKATEKSEQDESKKDGDKGDKSDDEKKQEEPQYRPLEEVSTEIREIWVKDKARAELGKRLAEMDRFVRDFSKVFLIARDKYEAEKIDNSGAQFVAPPAPDFAKKAEELGLTLAEVGPLALDDEEFRRTALGEAIESESGRLRGRSVAEVMSTADFYESRQFQNFVKDEYFSAWKTDDMPEEEPPFERIRDKVLTAYRMSKARAVASERAAKFAEALRERHGDIDKLREAEPTLTVITVPPTSLWTNAPMFSMRSRPGRVASELPGLHFPSDELRNKTFELNEGEVAVAPNEPLDTYYVVLLAKRDPATRENFARTRQFVESQIQSEQTERLYRDWMTDLRKESARGKGRAPAGN